MSPLLGIEIGGTKLQLGLGDGRGMIASLVTLSVDPSRGAEGIRAQVLRAFRSLEARPRAVGIGFGGPLDSGRGVVLTSGQIAGWDGFPLADWARSELGVASVALRNDADTAALGESRFGNGAGLSPILYVNSGSGIGGGLVVDGAIYRGSGLGAVEIGHLRVFGDDANHPPSEPRTLEQIASGWAIAEEGRRSARREIEVGREPGSLSDLAGGDPARITAQTVAEAARRSPDGPAAAILRRAASAMAQALAHAVTLLAPRRVILGGGVSLIQDDFWLEPIRKALEERVFPPFRGTFDVVTAALGQDVVVHGALALARDLLETSRTGANR